MAGKEVFCCLWPLLRSLPLLLVPLLLLALLPSPPLYFRLTLCCRPDQILRTWRGLRACNVMSACCMDCFFDCA